MSDEGTAREPSEGAPDPSEERRLFAQLAREAERSVRAFLLAAVRDLVAVDDLMQEAFLLAWRHFDRYDRTRPFGPWVRGIAGNLVLARRRTLARRKVFPVDQEALGVLSQAVEDLSNLERLELGEQIGVLNDCRQKLSEKYRRAIHLHYDKGMSCAEIAEHEGLKVEAVKKHLQRGRAALYDCISSRLDQQQEGGAA